MLCSAASTVSLFNNYESEWWLIVDRKIDNDNVANCAATAT